MPAGQHAKVKLVLREQLSLPWTLAAVPGKMTTSPYREYQNFRRANTVQHPREWLQLHVSSSTNLEYGRLGFSIMVIDQFPLRRELAACSTTIESVCACLVSSTPGTVSSSTRVRIVGLPAVRIRYQFSNDSSIADPRLLRQLFVLMKITSFSRIVSYPGSSQLILWTLAALTGSEIG